MVFLQFLTEGLCVCLTHPAAENVEGVILILCAGRKLSHIKVSGVGLQLPVCRSQFLCVRLQRAADFFIHIPDLFIKLRKLVFQLMGGLHRCSFIFIRKEKPFKMQGRVDCVNLVAKRLRHKVHQPDVIRILLTLMNHRINGIIHIIHKLVVVFMGHAAKPEFDIPKMHDILQVIVQICERNHPVHGFLNALHLRFQRFLLGPERLELLIQAVDGVHSILHGKSGESGILRLYHLIMFTSCRPRIPAMAIHCFVSFDLLHQCRCRLQLRLIWIDFQIRSQICHRFQLRQSVFQLDLIL